MVSGRFGGRCLHHRPAQHRPAGLAPLATWRPAAPPVGCLLCSVGQPQNVVTPGASGTPLPTKPFSVLNTTVDLLGAESLLVAAPLANKTPPVFPAGRKAGFIVAAPNEVLTASLITGFTVTTFLAGVQQDSAQLGGTGSSGLLGLQDLDLLTLPIGNVPGGYDQPDQHQAVRRRC